MIFCTLFDRNYLDKGIVMYQSLCKVCDRFKLYVLAIDSECKFVLDKISYENIIVIDINKFVEDMDLVSIKENRSRGEFCWTCTSHLIEYVLVRYNESICTYIDADLFFYSDPKPLVEEMGTKLVQIVEHRFDKSVDGRLSLFQSGKYCVQFNTFKNSKEALGLLRWWEKRCKESCSINDRKTGVFGDQGYLEKWEEIEYVSVLRNLGGGVAPWNVSQYILDENQTDLEHIVLTDKKTEEKFELVFYHFHNITYYDSKKININVYGRKKLDDRLIQTLYLPYLRSLDRVKEKLKNQYGIYPLLTSHPGVKKDIHKKINVKILLDKIDLMLILKIYIWITNKVISKKYTKKNIIKL